MSTCCVCHVSFKSTEKRLEGISFHRFPSGNKRPFVLQKWREFSGIPEGERIQDKRICSVHFRAEDFIAVFPKRKLCCGAVPCLCLEPDDILSLLEDENVSSIDGWSSDEEEKDEISGMTHDKNIGIDQVELQDVTCHIPEESSDEEQHKIEDEKILDFLYNVTHNTRYSIISLYRVSTKTRKWTVKMIFHAVDLAITNSWIEYVKDAGILEVSKKETLDLLHFRLRVAEALINEGKSTVKKRGRPLSEDNRKHIISRKNTEVRPVDEVRLDTTDHLPVHNNALPGRCKKNGCKGKSGWRCQKCQVFLCLHKDRNCFFDFHRKK
ncbi:hypothetical protein R5R35_012801 [Gryllus longicercus]|uniref:THAP-type domain-containing protein n=1 Tax=Gryllus longicercus TaxID=2509291 RepID=A0AAN9YYK2_9ORTH